MINLTRTIILTLEITMIFFVSNYAHADSYTLNQKIEFSYFNSGNALAVESCTDWGKSVVGNGEPKACRETPTSGAYYTVALCLYDNDQTSAQIQITPYNAQDQQIPPPAVYGGKTCPPTIPESNNCGEAGEFAYNGTGDSTTYCADGCELTVAGEGLSSDSNNTLWGAWEYTGTTCDDNYAGVQNPDVPDDNCSLYNGQEFCLDNTDLNCGTFNNAPVCVDSVPDGDCYFLSNGSMICDTDAPTDPAPDTGVVGEPALPDLQLTDKPSGDTYNVYNSNTVNNSTTENPNNDQGDSDIAQFCQDNPNAALCDSTGTQQNTNTEVTVEVTVDEVAIGNEVADSIGCTGDECQNINTGTASVFGETQTDLDLAKAEFLSAIANTKAGVISSLNATLVKGATLDPIIIPLPSGDVTLDLSLLEQVLGILGSALLFVSVLRAIAIVML